MQWEIVSTNINQPHEVQWRGKAVITSLPKLPVRTPLEVTHLGIKGDGQGDLKVHGGEDKAIYGYSTIALKWWESTLNKPVPPGFLGENLTIKDFDETRAYIGNTYSIGTCMLQIAQPRNPCFKIGIPLQEPNLMKIYLEAEFPGVYFRVLQPGIINPGDRLTLRSEDTHKISTVELHNIWHKKQFEFNRLQEIISAPPIMEKWQDRLKSMVNSAAKLK